MFRSTQSTTERHIQWDVWKVAAITILVLALATRFYALGDRAVSHDETTHAKYAWNLFTGQGFRHDPLMHGPLLFEATALFYGLFGVSDFTARLYTALAGVALVMVPWLFRRWIGRTGALVASVMLLISPTVTFYSRYTRHDIPIMLASLLLLWTVLRYLEDGRTRWLRWMGVFFALMYASKENAYIYTAIFGALMALPLLWQIVTVRWAHPELRRILVLLLVLAAVAGLFFVMAYRQGTPVAEGESNDAISSHLVPAWGSLSLGLAIALAGAAAVVLVRAVGEERLRASRMFDILLVLATLTLPLGSALLMNLLAGVDMSVLYPALMAGWASFFALPFPVILGAVLTLLGCLGVSVLLGLWWDSRRWLLIAGIYYGVFMFLFTTLLTYGWGGITGLVGALAYWMAQQGVQRGTQPWYYYGLIGGLYEYAPIAISLAGGVWAIVRWARGVIGRRRDAAAAASEDARRELPFAIAPRIPALLPFFLLAWAGMSWVAYAVAGEKMPWLFVHTALPHILLAAWAIDQLWGQSRWRTLLPARGWLVPVSLVFVGFGWTALFKSSGALREALEQSGAGAQLALTISQLEPLGRVIGGLIAILLFGWLLVSAIRRGGAGRNLRLVALTGIALLGVLTVRTTVMACFIDDELATEYLVYAHSTPDVNQALQQIDEVSWRVTGTADQVQVAYGKDVAWPFYWYMYTRYPNNYYFDTPDPDQLLASPVILAASSEWQAVDEIVGNTYEVYSYKHIWWPLEDYKNLTWERIRFALTDPAWRKAVWEIVWNRDYTLYAQLRDPEAPFTFKTWPHRLEFRLYVRRDLAAQAWSYQLDEGQVQAGAAVGQVPGVTGDDPFADVQGQMSADLRFALPAVGPRGVAVGPDGSMYVADPAANQILHLDAQGTVIATWGSYGVAPGQFNAPWDVAVDAAGDVYVADTWNHRVQKFDSTGTPLLSWGRFAEADLYDMTGYGAFFGPRGIAIGPDGNVYVADTGNNRVEVFDPQGTYLRAFGGAGDGAGQLSEPAGIAVAASGEVYVADAWHRQIQVFDATGLPAGQWDVPVWNSLSADDRPYLAVVGDRVVATDPAYGRLLVFDAQGELVQALADAEIPLQPAGIAAAEGSLRVTNLSGPEITVYSDAVLAGP